LHLVPLARRSWTFFVATWQPKKAQVSGVGVAKKGVAYKKSEKLQECLKEDQM